MAFDPTTAKLVNAPEESSTASTFDVSSAKPVQAASQTQPVKPEEPSMLQKAGSVGLAAAGGLSNAAANTIQAVNDTPAFILKHLGAISPESAEKWYKINSENVDVLRSSSKGDQSDLVNKAAAEHPYVHGGAELAGNVYGLTKATQGINALGSAAGALSQTPAISTALGVGGRAVGSGLTNQAIADPQNKEVAFGVGAALSPAIDLAGYGISKLGAKAVARKELKDKLTSANTALKDLSADEQAGGSIANLYKVTNEVAGKQYDKIRALPYTDTERSAAYTLSRNIDDFIENSKIKLSDSQYNVLKETSDSLVNANNTDELLKTLQEFKRSAPTFSGKEASNKINSQYKVFKNSLNSIIDKVAVRGGEANTLQRANLMWERMVKPMDEIGAKDISDAVEKYGVGSDEVKQVTNNIIDKYLDAKGVGKFTKLMNSMDDTGQKIVSNHIVKKVFDKVSVNPEFDFAKAYNKLDQYATKYKSILSNDSKLTLEGVMKTMKAAGLDTVKKDFGSGTYATHTLGASLGGAVLGGIAGGPLGSGVGVVAAPVIVNSIKNLLNTENGQAFLRSLTKPGVTMKMLKDVARAMTIGGTTETIDAANPKQKDSS